VTAGQVPDAASEAVEGLRRRGLTIAIAESLTGGLLVAELIRIPGASEVVRGGVVAYATELKSRLLGVDADILSARGPVDPDVAVQMARGVRLGLGPGAEPASIGISTTGVAGPGPQDGHPAGTVFVGFHDRDADFSTALALAGDRESIRRQTVDAAIRILLDRLSAG
jgi:nicotinamide-nucleotide amidase